MADSFSISASTKRLKGEVAIITGGASGAGKSAVELFWANGAKVVIADIQDELGQEIATKLGENTCYIHCDVTKEDDVMNLVDTTVAKYGHLDIMYNNAGILDRHVVGGILDTKVSDIERMLKVNLVGPFIGAKHAARVMVPRRKGCILFTASSAAAIAGVGTHSYAASKHGVVGLMKNLAAELGQFGIRVNSVSPFGFASGLTSDIGSPQEIEYSTEMMGNLKGAFLKASDVAKGALFLASDEASYVSGLDLVVDGGYSVVNPTIRNAYPMIQGAPK